MTTQGKKLKRGDIVLVPFPFSDLKSSKVRPALIVSGEPQQQDLILAFVSSVIREAPDKTEHTLLPENKAFELTGLHKASVFRMSKLLTLERSMLMRRLGRVPDELMRELDQCLKYALGLVHK